MSTADISATTTTTSISPFTRSLLAGALAGTTVDLSLYPLDTLKTRLQSSSGFVASGGFRGVYAGVGSAIIGSAPGAALFFVTYERSKSVLKGWRRNTDSFTWTNESSKSYGRQDAVDHMAAASLGELAACTVRVPTEVIKQRTQASQYPSSFSALVSILDLRRTHGLATVVRELYRGFNITIFREVPFTCIQFPLWEYFKSAYSARATGASLKNAVETPSRAPTVTVPASTSAMFGSLSGAIAACATTPLDVLKTRMMLAKRQEGIPSRGVLGMARDIYKNEGWRVFFAGVGPRVGWISVGGAVFLGSYQWASNMMEG